MATDKAAKTTDRETPTCPTCGAAATPAGDDFVCTNDSCPDHGEVVG
jgi:hypothetical protein